MRLPDLLHFNAQALLRHPARSGLMLLAVGMGVAAVVLLTGLGEGARRYVNQEFSSLGSQLLIVFPGKKETSGAGPPIYGSTPRDLTLEDAAAIARSPTIAAVAPIIAGNAVANFGNRSREVITLGSTQDLFQVRQLTVSEGRPLTSSNRGEAEPKVVLGAKLRRELFGNQEAVGQWLRLGDRRFRVVGVLSERGESLGLDLRDMAIIPVRSAEQLFNSPGLFRILIELEKIETLEYTKQEIIRIIRQRHEGEDDITIVSQDSVMKSFSSIITTLTAVVGAIASISLVVAGILIMNVSLVSVTQRREEIGLLKSLGATRVEIWKIFLSESLLLVTLGALLGLAFARGVFLLVHIVYPFLPLAAPWWAMLAALIIAIGCGLLFAWWPAQKAAAVDPVLALRGGPN